VISFKELEVLYTVHIRQQGCSILTPFLQLYCFVWHRKNLQHKKCSKILICLDSCLINPLQTGSRSWHSQCSVYYYPWDMYLEWQFVADCLSDGKTSHFLKCLQCNTVMFLRKFCVSHNGRCDSDLPNSRWNGCCECNWPWATKYCILSRPWAWEFYHIENLHLPGV
jgi:hypothetical protein